jgi:type IV pilus assembly protein PilB
VIFGFGRSKAKAKQQDDEELEDEFVLFQGAVNGNNPDLSANPKLVQAGLPPTKQLISDALNARADMIRLEPKGQVAICTIFIDGAPTAPTKMSAQQALAITQMVKLLSGIDPKVKGKAQTGGIKASHREMNYELRVNLQPVEGGGERLILRAYDASFKLEKPKDLGFADSLIEKIRDLASSKSGVILAAGPPFSGLTTLKIALMRCTDAYLYSIYVLADFGRELSYVKMFEKNEGDDLTKTMLRAQREDADVLVIDPIDAPADAKAALEASESSAIISDMHARDAADAIVKLAKTTGNAQLVASQLKIVVSQMFVRMLCKKCRRAYRPNPKLLAQIGLPPETRVLYRPHHAGAAEDEDDKQVDNGICRECNGLGYRGKLALLEFIEMTPAIQKIVVGGGDQKALRSQARAEKMQTFQSDGLRTVLEGSTSLEELQRAFKAQ